VKKQKKAVFKRNTTTKMSMVFAVGVALMVPGGLAENLTLNRPVTSNWSVHNWHRYSKDVTKLTSGNGNADPLNVLRNVNDGWYANYKYIGATPTSVNLTAANNQHHNILNFKGLG